VPADQPKSTIEARRALGRRIAEARIDANLTQEELASRAQVDRSTVQRVEVAANDPKISHLLRIASALGVSLRDLLP
jgi:transcriptional regulator with XRE-family HTH domain